MRTASLLLCFCCSLSLHAQFWRTDAMVDVIADSIEASILRHPDKRLKILDQWDEFAVHLKTKWLNDSIVVVRARSRNVEYGNLQGRYNRVHLLKVNDALCLYDWSNKELAYCPESFSDEVRAGLVQEDLKKIFFERDDLGRIIRIFDHTEEISRTVSIRYLH